MRPTIHDVAREAGVSISSVSNALTGKKKVSEETRKKIDAAARRLGYVADQAASSLKSGSTHIIGLIVPSIDSAFFPAVISGLQATLAESGYIINFYSTGFDAEAEKKYISALLASNADGIILDSVSCDEAFLSSLSRLGSAKKRVPVIALERDLTQYGLTSVFSDNFTGGRLAARHLLERGVRRAAHIGGLSSAPWSRERFDGFRAELAEAGFPFDDRLFVDGDFTLEGGRRAARILHERGVEFDGLFAANDLSAVGAMLALTDLGVGIPENVALIGFDNTYVTSLTTPPISTIDVPKRRLGELAGEAILRMAVTRAIESPYKIESLELPLTLIVRHSSDPTSSPCPR